MFQNLIDLLFLGFSTNLILSCILTITAYNAVGALIALIFAFINATCIFFLMELEFIGLLFLIVYVGAISVLFLFSVMLFNLKEVVRTKTTSFILKNIITLLSIAILFLFFFQYFIEINNFNIIDFNLNSTIFNFFPNIDIFQNNIYDFNESGLSKNSDIYYIGQVMYNRYLIYLVLSSIILLIAMLGAVVLINNPKEQIQMQHILKQLTRTVQITNLK